MPTGIRIRTYIHTFLLPACYLVVLSVYKTFMPSLPATICTVFTYKHTASSPPFLILLGNLQKHAAIAAESLPIPPCHLISVSSVISWCLRPRYSLVQDVQVLHLISHPVYSFNPKHESPLPSLPSSFTSAQSVSQLLLSRTPPPLIPHFDLP